MADLGDVQPLRLTHHSWGGKFSHCNHGWLLPKSFTVIGSLPPLVTTPSCAYGPAWGRGEQLARQRQRQWDSGDRSDWTAPYALTWTADELAAERTSGRVRAGVEHLTVRGITRLDCSLLVAPILPGGAAPLVRPLPTRTGHSRCDSGGCPTRDFLRAFRFSTAPVEPTARKGQPGGIGPVEGPAARRDTGRMGRGRLVRVPRGPAAVAVGGLLLLGPSGVGVSTVPHPTAAPPTAAPPTAPTAGSGPADGGRQVALPDGRMIYVDCRGHGSPTVVLVSGIHDSSDVWSMTETRPPVPASPATLPGIARGARVCAYDRPGTIRYTTPPTLTDRSSPVAMPRSLPALVTELDQTLTAAGERGPYLLVGHSFGGMIIRFYAQTHPERTAGLVFVDAFGPEIRDGLGADWSTYARLVNRPGVPVERDPSFETIDLDGAMTTVAKGPRLPSVPMAVISKTAPFEVAPGTPHTLMKAVEAAWPRLQDSLVALRPNTPHVLATGSDHYVQLHDPDLVTATVDLVLTRARHRPTAWSETTPARGSPAQ